MILSRQQQSAIKALIPLDINIDDSVPETLITAFLLLESSHWHYTDNVQPANKQLPALGLKAFISVYLPNYGSERLSNSLRLLNRYKKTLSIYGSILLNPDMSKILLVRNCNSTSWSFPKGKQELGENEFQSVIRETFEETNFCIRGLLSPDKKIKHRKATFFIIENIPEYLIFVPWKRAEIAEVCWHEVGELSTDSKYNIYIRHIYQRLNQWIEQRHASPDLLPVFPED